jgi:hypothetical protein
MMRELIIFYNSLFYKEAKMKRILSLITIFCLTITLFLPIKVEAASLKLNKEKVTLEMDAKLKLTLGKLSGTKSTWESSNEKIVTVNKWGIITAKSEGTAIVSATYQNNRYTCTVNVVDNNKIVESTGTTGTPSTTISSDAEVTQVYQWTFFSSNYIAFAIKNISKSTISATINVQGLDASGNCIGTNYSTEDAISAGNEVLVVFSIAKPYSSYDYSLVTKPDNENISVCENMKLTTSIDGKNKKAYLTVKNEGTLTADYLGYKILYFKDGKIVSNTIAYFGLYGFKINQGETRSVECLAASEFDSIKVWLYGKGSK